MSSFTQSPVNKDFEDPVKMVERQLNMIGLRDLNDENDENAPLPSLSRSIDSFGTQEASRGRPESLGSAWSDGEDEGDVELRRRSLTGAGGRYPSESGGRKAVFLPQRFAAVSPLHCDSSPSGLPAHPAGGLDICISEYDTFTVPDDAMFGSSPRSRGRHAINPANPFQVPNLSDDMEPPHWPAELLQENPEHHTNTSTGGVCGGEEEEEEEEEETEEKHGRLFKRSVSFMSLPDFLKPSTYRKKQAEPWIVDPEVQEKIKASPKLQQFFGWDVDGDEASSGDDGGSGLSNAELLQRAEDHVKDWETYPRSDSPIARKLPVHIVDKLRERMTKEEFEDPISVAKSALRMHPC